ncbi:MAG: hypothetical protein GDA43_20605 [Hormoscilla sp. SP5CHS1]|nr:hypothetical protein [Hormoscilla sp. SP12CHS1]MBC6455304.1 hypothetical protein [Hormoscilla sp. SP5CHS1]
MIARVPDRLYSNSTLLCEVTVVNAVDNGDGGNLHARRAKISLAGAIAGWGDEAIDFDAQPEAGDRSK